MVGAALLFLTVSCSAAVSTPKSSPAVTDSPGPVSLAVVSPSDGRIQYSGRIDFSDPAAPRFDWPGVSIGLHFKGRAVGFRIEDGGNDYNLLVDGKLAEVWSTEYGVQDYSVDDLADGEHTALLTKRTEAAFGIGILRGVLLDSRGTLLAPAPKPTRRIEVIGDSWVAGYGNEGASLNCSDLRSKQNNYESYGPIAARQLGAEGVVLAYSGKGVVRNYGDPQRRSAEPYPLLYPRTLATRPEPLWDFGSFVPDVVVIGLGANDFSTEPKADTGEFTDAFVRLLETIRSHYPDAWIVVFNTASWLTATNPAVARRNGAGDWRVVSIGYREIRADEMGCDYHPKVAVHQELATLLAGEIRRLTGW